MWNASRFCVSSLRRGHANLLCIVPILVYVLPKQVQCQHQIQAGWLKLVDLGVLWTLRVSEKICHRPWCPCWTGIAPFSERKKFLPDRESNPGLPRDRRRSSPLDYRGLDSGHCAKMIAWLRKWMHSSQLESSWWERRVLCYPAYTGLNCSHIRWPYSGQWEHSTGHHITCTHSGLSLVSYL